MAYRWLLLFVFPCILHCTENSQQESVSVPEPGPALQTLKGKRILFVAGGWEGHHPQKCAELYVPLLQNAGAEVMLTNSLEAYTDSTLMASMDLIIQVWTLGEITDLQLHGLLTAVRNGTGFAGWHGGVIDAFRGAIDYHLMTGGQFLAHPGDILQYDIRVSDTTDAVMEGIEDFTVNTEQYYILTDPNIHVLADTRFKDSPLQWLNGRRMPVIWKHSYGKGKVFVNAIGHRMEDHQIPEFRTTMQRGIAWACRK